MKTLIFYIIAVAVTFSCLGQASQTDNLSFLKKYLANTSSNKDQVEILIQIAKHYLHTQPDSSILYAKRAQAIANEDGNMLALAKSKRLVGESFLLQGAYARAIELLLQASKHFEEVGEKEELGENHLVLGKAYQFSKQLSTAQTYYEAALAIFTQTANAKGLADTYGSIGHIYEKQGNYNKALSFQEKALRLYNELEHEEGMATIFDNLGSIYEDLAVYDSAYFYFKASAELHRSTNNAAGLIVSLNNIGDVFRKQGDLEQGIQYTKESLLLAQKLNHKYQMRSAYRDLSKLYGLNKDFEKAYLYMDSTYVYSGDIFNEQIAEQIANLQTLYEIQSKEQEIALLESEKKVDSLIKYLFIGGILLISIVAYIIIKHQRLKIKKNKELLETQQRIHDAEQELTKTALYNTQLKEKSLETALENKQLKEEQLSKELAIKDKEMTTRALHIIQKNKMLKDLKENIQEIKKTGNGSIKKSELNKLGNLIDYSFSFDKDWEDFQRSFEQVHAQFFDQLKLEHPHLTSSELRLCALLRLNLNSKDIATILGISQDSLRIARYRLRKKFDLPKGSNLSSHIMHF